ncbi:phosphate signaling complex protein PhoU [Candidatus Thiothrix anitrata]|jgi:phosphate transport system protein|uniref:Phosphate-specific transport system accessory protein PhoU n=2 Tax=Candidatus Thiothrix anitrata TaxID=2823902 RepID=A0ABX7X1Q1_9GAMM|nr:phosphate signaling complex protein PhoU [Candidatus Thiothrix anitrata]QTR48703.1 phosphate signaling complex protein PhoU [Candidatus Thiothrix anitrata]
MESMNTTQHTSQKYNHELEEARSKLMTMGGLVETQVTNAIKALLERDSALGEKVAYSDHEINAMEVLLDEHCAEIIARRQPAASDLRLLITIIKVITDLERIGDEAEKVGRYAVEMTETATYGDLHNSLRHLGEHVKAMLSNTLDALARLDVAQAMQVVKNDQKVDDEFDSITRQLYTRMLEDPRNIKDSLNVTWCARSLERVGDHCKNICEYVIYLVKGKDVRHTNLESIRETILGDD